MEDDGPRRQIYVRAKQGKPLQTTLDDLLKFFEDAAVGKPTNVLNKWGEEPENGRIYELALVTFKKNKAVQRALGLSGSYLGDREVTAGTLSHPHAPAPSRRCPLHAVAHTLRRSPHLSRWSSRSTIGLPSRAVRYKPSPSPSPSPSPTRARARARPKP